MIFSSVTIRVFRTRRVTLQISGKELLDMICVILLLQFTSLIQNG